MLKMEILGLILSLKVVTVRSWDFSDKMCTQRHLLDGGKSGNCWGYLTESLGGTPLEASEP